VVPRKPDGFRLKVFLWDESRFFVSKVIFIQSKGAHTMSDYRISAAHGPGRQWTFGPACGTMAQTAGGGRRRGRSAMAFTPIDEQTWERREYLEVFRQTAIYLTAEVDITPLYRHTKARGEKLYPALIWCAAAVLNRHVHFRYGRDEAEAGPKVHCRRGPCEAKIRS